MKYLFFFTLGFSIWTFAHEEHQKNSPSNSEKPDESNKNIELYSRINASYETNIKPIFQSKCMNCHSSQTTYPFYYNWPIAKQIIDDDTAEAKKHLDMESGFPFAGHGTPLEDLEAIRKAVIENEMPPLRYKILHWGSGLTETERQTIIQWTDESIAAFRLSISAE